MYDYLLYNKVTKIIKLKLQKNKEIIKYKTKIKIKKVLIEMSYPTNLYP